MSELEIYRTKIDSLDKKILVLLANRMKLVYKIGVFKRNNQLPPLDMKRWLFVLETRVEQGKALGLSKKFIGDFFELIHEQSLKIERKV